MHHTAKEMAALGGENRLTEAELEWVRHALDAELLGVKKALHYAEEIENENARRLMQEQADIHHRRVDMLLELLAAPGDVTKQAKRLLQSAQEQGGEHHD